MFRLAVAGEPEARTGNGTGHDYPVSPLNLQGQWRNDMSLQPGATFSPFYDHTAIGWADVLTVNQER